MRSHSRAHCELIVSISEFGARVRSTPSAGDSCDMAGRSLQFGEVSQTQPVQFRWDGAQWRGTAFSVSQNVPWNVPALPVAPNAPPSAGALQAAAGGTLTALQPGRRAQVAAQSSQPVVAVPVPLVVGACASMSGANSARAGPPMLQSGVTNVAAPPPGATIYASRSGISDRDAFCDCRSDCAGLLRTRVAVLFERRSANGAGAVCSGRSASFASPSDRSGLLSDDAISMGNGFRWLPPLVRNLGCSKIRSLAAQVASDARRCGRRMKHIVLSAVLAFVV